MFSSKTLFRATTAHIIIRSGPPTPTYPGSGSDSFGFVSLSTNQTSINGSSDWDKILTAIYYGNHRGSDSFNTYNTGSTNSLQETPLWISGAGKTLVYGSVISVISSDYSSVGISNYGEKSIPYIISFGSESVRNYAQNVDNGGIRFTSYSSE